MASLYMFPSITNKFLKKSSGLTSPTFLQFQKQKRKRRRFLTKRSKVVKKVFKKMRERSIMRQAFKNIYFATIDEICTNSRFIPPFLIHLMIFVKIVFL